jgi:phosphatidate cytidylyltransferase
MAPADDGEPGRSASETRNRILFALPAIAFCILIVDTGGLAFALGVFALGCIALREFYGLVRGVRPVDLAGFIGLLALVLAALYGEPKHILLALVAAFPLTFALVLARPWRERAAWAIAATLFGILWIGLPLAHAVLLRELDHGSALLIDVLIATFVGDTFAYFAGRAIGSRPLAPRISPSKSVEGLVAGVVGGTFAFWLFAVLYQDFFDGLHALIIGLSVALVSPLGDLFQSLIKRDLEVKDTGRFFGAHGGVLDRLDAALWTVVVGYYVAVAVGFG